MNDHPANSGSHAQSSGPSQSYGMTAARADVLSEVLTLIRLRGELVYTAELGAPWGIRYAPGPAHFHFVEHGPIWVIASGSDPLRLDAGDLVLLPHGRGHVIADNTETHADNIDWLSTQYFNRDDLSFRFGGGGEKTKIVGGFFSFEGSPLPAIMSALPTVIHIPRAPGGAQPWLAAISHFLVAEANQPNPGSSLMISRLIDLLVIRALRSWAAGRAERGGWLGGLGEQRIGRVLSAIHNDPFRPWTVQALADIALMSRSIFAERFVSTVGEPPLHYVTRWRLTIADDLIHSGGLKVTQAAQRIGYASDAAFSRAFKAHFGRSPSEVKR